MRDGRAAGDVADALEDALMQAIEQVAGPFPSGQHGCILDQLCTTLGGILINAPITTGDAVAGIRDRARLAAALHSLATSS